MLTRQRILFSSLLCCFTLIFATWPHADNAIAISTITAVDGKASPHSGSVSSSPETNKTSAASSNNIDAALREFAAIDTTVEEPEILNIFEELFQLTYKVAPDIRIARALRRQRSEQRYTAWAKRLAPALDANLSQVHEFNMDEDEQTAAPGTADSQNNSEISSPYSYLDDEDYADWSFRMDLPIYRRSVSLGVDIATVDERLAENNLVIKSQELDINLRELLGNYLEACYRLLNMRNSVQLSRQHVDKIYRGYELRDQTRLQLLRAQANLKELEARRDLDEQRRDVAFRELLDYSGLHRDAPVFQRLNTLLTSESATAGCINSLADLDSSYEKIEQFIDPSDGPVLNNYFRENSLLYQKITLERELSENKAKVYTQNEWPSLAVRGLYDRREDTQFSKFNGEGSLALVLSVPLFTGGTLFSNTKTQAMAQHIASVTEYTDLRKTVHSIENNRNLIISLQKVFATQQIHLQQQREIVVLSLKSYKIKQTSMQDLLTSKNRLIDAKNALMETTNKLGSLYRLFAWELGCPYPVPTVEEITEPN